MFSDILIGSIDLIFVSDQHEDGSVTSLGQAMAEIPSQYFEEAFDVDWGSIASSDFIETYTDLVDELARQVVSSEHAGHLHRSQIFSSIFSSIFGKTCSHIKIVVAGSS